MQKRGGALDERGFLMEQADKQDECLQYSIRELQEDDWNCILKSWMRSYRATRPNWRDYYIKKHEEIVLYRERGAVFKIACDPEDPTSIFGWSCGEPPVIHFVYVKPYYREQGIAKVLVRETLGDAKIIAYTHYTEAAEEIASTHKNLRLVTLG
jgi:ribosomal protein S18 acetylase RimI-like enzyme